MTKVLVIEDDANIRSNLVDLLETEGFTVASADNGEAGLTLARDEHAPSLIICDIMMPGLDGYGVVQALRQDEATAAIPFIFLTAKAERSDLRHGMELGADDFVTKPFTRDDLLRAIESRLARAHAVRHSTQVEFEELKRQIGTVLAHELRTPLTSVMGYTDLALEDVSTLSTEQLLRLLWGIKQGSARLARLVEDLLVLVQIDTGQVVQDFEATVKVYSNLGEVIEQTIEFYQSAAQANGITLVTNIDPDLPAVRLSQPLFGTAFGHLIANAIKFSKNHAGSVTVSAHRSGAGLDIAVADQGTGIAAEDLPHIFERFRQINRSRNEQQGVGLGLAVARELIRLHGGDIDVESVLGIGSTFTIHLPAAHQSS